MSNRLHDNYMSDIAHVAIMTDAEEKALALEIEKGSQEALNRLVGANLRYVVTLANTYKNCGLETEDLISEGNIGLMKAAAKFRADHNKRFAPFAAPYIRQSIETAIARHNGNADETDGLRLHSMDAPVPMGSQNTYTLLNILENPDAERSDKAIEQQTSTEMIKRRLRRLNKRQRAVIKKLYGIGCPPQTMMEAAMDLGLKRERVRQIRNQALRKLRKNKRWPKSKRYPFMR